MRKILVASAALLGLTACQSLTPAQDQALLNAGMVGCAAVYAKNATKLATCQAAVSAGIPLAAALSSAGTQ